MRWWRDKADSLLGEWNIGVVEQDISTLMEDGKLPIRWMRHAYRDCWFADPFLLGEDERHYEILVEEMQERKGKGVISLLTVEKSTMNLLERRVVLEEDGHLSFPYIYKKGGKTFLLPEKGRAGAWDLYQYDEGEKRFEKVKEICRQPFADAIFMDENTILATMLPKPNGKLLSVWKNDGGDWIESSTICFLDCVARNAGQMFQWKGEWYRPAQICNCGYGEGVCIQKMVCSGKAWAFSEVRRFYPRDREYRRGLHTFNVYREGSLVLVDGLRYRYQKLFGG